MQVRPDFKFENDFLFDNQDAFFKAVFKDEPLYVESCIGLISAHADKCEQYRDYWDRYHIPHAHAMFIYLLTFTKEFGSTPKHMSKEWVVVNYHRYETLLNSFKE